MKTVFLGLWLCLNAIPALAQCSAAVGCSHVGAPAPLLGLGIPSALGIGGVLLGAKLLKRKR